MNDLEGKVAVITGASSGIGRATALDFAQAGAKVVLAARDAAALTEIELECQEAGPGAIAIVCDVTDEEQVERLASRAEKAYGHIDIWVNNAGVALFAKFEDSTTDDFRRVFDTNFFGYVHGARAALKRFRNQMYGHLINVDSIEGITPKPYHAAYAASKHAVRALSSSLRMELLEDGMTDIHVSTVIPSSVDTPLFAHAANYTGRSLQAPATSISAANVAAAITLLAVHPQRELIIGSSAMGQSMKYILTPGQYERQTSSHFPKRHMTDTETATTAGNLYETMAPHTSNGGWKKTSMRSDNHSRNVLALAGAVVAASGIIAWALWPKSTPQD
jgi:NAD(P)-dependent dehydrogenase (short-subunit alcohol dehydrogenase family)